MYLRHDAAHCDILRLPTFIAATQRLQRERAFSVARGARLSLLPSFHLQFHYRATLSDSCTARHLTSTEPCSVSVRPTSAMMRRGTPAAAAAAVDDAVTTSPFHVNHSHSASPSTAMCSLLVEMLYS